MKEKQFVIKTKRLKLYPLSDSEIEKKIEECADDGLAAAYTQMLEGCKKDPSARQWYAPWVMETKDGGKRIGDAGFKGLPLNHSVEIGYGINKEYEGQGYTTEAAKALTEWAFGNEGVLFVEAEADENNAASLRILEKLGFKKYGQGEEGPRFTKVKPPMSYTSIGMSLGLCLGMSLGITLFKEISTGMTIGMCMGLSLGLCFGAAKDHREKVKRDEIIKNKYGESFNFDGD